jgi:hypothetical protein
MALRWKLYEGKKILQCDFRGLGPDLSLLLLEETGRILLRCNDRILMVSTFDDTQVDTRFVQRVHELGRHLVREKATKVALVGIDSMKYVVREAYAKLAGMCPCFFRSEEEALQWLVN